MKKNILILGLVMLLSAGSAFAQGGTLGTITWVIEDSTLIISGEGAIPDYTGPTGPITGDMAPWFWCELDNSCFYSAVVIEGGITRIGNNAFSLLRNVTSATIPSSVASIGKDAFSYCETLISITIPNVTSIGDWAFSDCENLRLITNFNPIPIAINANVFDGVNKSACTLEVPINSVEAYKEAAVWKDFKIVGVEVGMESIEEPAFKIYPNPTNGKVYIETESAIKVYDAQGTLLQETFGNQVDLSAYPQGVYLLQVNDGRWSRVVKQ